MIILRAEWSPLSKTQEPGKDDELAFIFEDFFVTYYFWKRKKGPNIVVYQNELTKVWFEQTYSTPLNT